MAKIFTIPQRAAGSLSQMQAEEKEILSDRVSNLHFHPLNSTNSWNPGRYEWYPARSLPSSKNLRGQEKNHKHKKI